MTKEGSLLYLRNQLQKVELLIRKAEQRLQTDDLPARVHAAGELVALRHRHDIVARKLTRVQDEKDGLWTSLKDEIRVDLDAISAALGHLTHQV